MEATYSLAQRFREVILDGTWVANTNFKDQLSGLDWKIAVTPCGSPNTIAILAQHIHYYIAGIKEVFTGGRLEIKDQYSFQFPPVESGEDWEHFLNRFWKDAEEFAALVEQMPQERLQEVFVDEKYGTYLRNINGMIEHSYYHLGQIVLIKKMLLTDPSFSPSA